MRESQDYMMSESLESGNRRYNRGGGYGNSLSSGITKPNLVVRNVISDYQNFLRDAPILKYNQKPNEEG